VRNMSVEGSLRCAAESRAHTSASKGATHDPDSLQVDAGDGCGGGGAAVARCRSAWRWDAMGLHLPTSFGSDQKHGLTAFYLSLTQNPCLYAEWY
jgi:hypothetical protein